MPQLAQEVLRFSLVIEIGGTRVRVNTADENLLSMLRIKYAEFIGPSNQLEAELDINVEGVEPVGVELELEVAQRSGRWSFHRQDFHAEWDHAIRHGQISQIPKPYSTDAVLRIVHTLVLAKQGGFLMHAASAVRNGKAFLFAGV